MPIKLNRILYVFFGLFCLTLWCSSSLALIIGIFWGAVLGNHFVHLTKKITPKMLTYSVVGLGAGMNLKVIGEVGMKGLTYTALGIAFAGAMGLVFSKIFRVSRDCSALITVGTAICGGSAIAALAPILKAKDHDISVSLALVFLLNSIALVIFPPLGHYFNLSQEQFGLWGALAIHDTSSVVGATMQYGAQALQVGTTVKLARALWIVPISFLAAALVRTQETKHSEKSEFKDSPSAKLKIPWFILGFLIAAAVVTFFPELKIYGDRVAQLSRQFLVLTLFLIGSGLNKKTIGEVGVGPLVLGVSLWIVIATVSIVAIKIGFIHN